MDWLFNKPASGLQATDLKRLLGMTESQRLECKREPYPRHDEGVREMLRDITSIANSAGGYLIIGADTDGDEKVVALDGIDSGEEEAIRMISSCRAAIEEQIIGLHPELVLLPSGRHVLVWYIPRSTRKPHMVTFKGMFQCWVRHGTRKDKMSIEEIREACVRTENIRQSLEGFLRDRRNCQVKVAGKVPHPYSGPHLLLSATPLVVRDELVDTSDEVLRSIIRRPPYQRAQGYCLDFSGTSRAVRPTMYGAGIGLESAYRIDLHRNGHLEAMIPLYRYMREQERTREKTLNPSPLAEFTLSFLHLFAAIFRHTAIFEPFVVGLAISRAHNLRVCEAWPGTAAWDLGDASSICVWSEELIELPYSQFPHPVEPLIVARFMCDRLWNAFGFERCTLFGENGEFKKAGAF